MNCNNCARKVTDALQQLNGVSVVVTDVENRRVSVRWSATAQPDARAAIGALDNAGYPAKLIELQPDAVASHNHTGWHLNLWLGGIITAALMSGEWLFHAGDSRLFQWLSLALASVVQIHCGAQFYRGMWR